MFYEPRNGHGLPHNPFNAIVVPRPIGWITTLDPDGNVNLAPFSFFNAVAYVPPQVMFATTGPHPQEAGAGRHIGSLSQRLPAHYRLECSSTCCEGLGSLSRHPLVGGLDLYTYYGKRHFHNGQKTASVGHLWPTRMRRCCGTNAERRGA